MKITIAAVSDRGCVRESNEDMLLVGKDIFRDDCREVAVDLNGENKKFFVAVADGMGGHNAGEVASEIVLRKMNERINDLEMNLTEEELSTRVSEWVQEIHWNILKEGNSDNNRKGMGTTLIGVLFYNNRIYYLNVGDSRLYRWRNGYLMQISQDHSLNEMIQNEDIASNIIINSFGGDENVFVDFAPVGGKIFDNDILLLCSDGLSDELRDEEMEKMLLNNEDAIDMLLNKAKSKGGKDNISIILVYLSGIKDESNR